jgi:hypothetical protein
VIGKFLYGLSATAYFIALCTDPLAVTENVEIVVTHGLRSPSLRPPLNVGDTLTITVADARNTNNKDWVERRAIIGNFPS